MTRRTDRKIITGDLGCYAGPPIARQRHEMAVEQNIRDASAQLGTEMRHLISRTAAQYKWSTHEAQVRLHCGVMT